MVKIIDKDNKYPLIIILLVSFFVLLVGLAIFFSKVDFVDKPEGTVASIVYDGDLVINYVDGEKIDVYDSKTHEYGITITNNSTGKIYYSIYLDNINLAGLNFKITDKEGNEVSKMTSVIGTNKIINLNTIEADETLRFILVIENDKLINLNGSIKVVNDSLTNETFSDLILLNNNISLAKTRIGIDVATDNEGLIMNKDNKGTTYYFRGNVNNNYVKIGDFLFRIVRINGDSTVRLVLNDVLEGQQAYNVNSLKEGEEASKLALLANSTLLTNLNNWAESNLGEYNKFLTNGDFCTDNIFNNTINGINYSSTYTRVFEDNEPSLYCNGAIYSGKVGLLNVDEIMFAGANLDTPNSEYYLYNNKIEGNYITSSSYFINSANAVAMVNVIADGSIGDGILISTNSYIRPVINIGISAKVKGNGTMDDPYIIVA